jgi:hypothetical protein
MERGLLWHVIRLDDENHWSQDFCECLNLLAYLGLPDFSELELAKCLNFCVSSQKMCRVAPSEISFEGNFHRPKRLTCSSYLCFFSTH